MNKKLPVRARKAIRSRPVLSRHVVPNHDSMLRASEKTSRPEVVVFLEWLALSNMENSDSEPAR